MVLWLPYEMPLENTKNKKKDSNPRKFKTFFNVNQLLKYNYKIQNTKLYNSQSTQTFTRSK